MTTLEEYCRIDAQVTQELMKEMKISWWRNIWNCIWFGPNWMIK